MEELFSDIVIALKVFATLPVTVAGGERSFSTMAYIKNRFRSTMSGVRLNSLAVLAMHSETARECSFHEIVAEFARKQVLRDPEYFNP